MFKLAIYFVLLITVRLYSGGVCVGEWETRRTSSNGYTETVWFTDCNTNNKIKIAGAFTITDDDIKRKGKRK